MVWRPGSKTRTRVVTVDTGQRRIRPDYLATEEPLEIRLTAGSPAAAGDAGSLITTGGAGSSVTAGRAGGSAAAGGVTTTVAVTMRTPGADFELAAGFLYAEGLVGRDDIARISYCVDPKVDMEQRYNIVNVGLATAVLPDLPTLERHFVTSSACGVCGKASLDALELRGCSVLPAGPEIDADLLLRLPGALRDEQGLFEATGGLHAAALFSSSGELIVLREDVGRHNAVDKLIGWALMSDRLPLHDYLLMVSGRASYEIMQKALAAGIPIVCAVSAPSSLAVDVARRFGMTLVGFLRGQRFNIYAGETRLLTPATTS